MTTETFTHGSLSLTYGITGAGSEVVLAFHGFGQSPDVWERWSTAIPASKHMLSIGLFGHGTSSFPLSRMKKRPLEKAEWSELIAALLESRGIHQVEIWAYSMGSRMAMSFIERYPERVSRMILFAPDGLKRNLLYRFACETALGRWLFDQGLRHDQVLIGLIAMLSRMRFMPHRLGQFLSDQLSSKDRRVMVYESWLIHRRLFPSTDLRKFQGQGIVCFGQHDAVIPPRLRKNAERLFAGQVKMVDSPFGHRMLTPEFADWLVQQTWWV